MDKRSGDHCLKLVIEATDSSDYWGGPKHLLPCHHFLADLYQWRLLENLFSVSQGIQAELLLNCTQQCHCGKIPSLLNFIICCCISSTGSQRRFSKQEANSKNYLIDASFCLITLRALIHSSIYIKKSPLRTPRMDLWKYHECEGKTGWTLNEMLWLSPRWMLYVTSIWTVVPFREVCEYSGGSFVVGEAFQV